MPKPDWTLVRESIAERIARGEFCEGDRLPTEPELVAEFGLGRHSVRRAVAALAIDGVLSVEQGRGTFVRRQPLIRYRIGRRTRFRDNLKEQGRAPSGDLLLAETMPAPERIAAALDIGAGVPVHRVLARGLADGMPVSLGQSFHEVARFPDFGLRRAAGEAVSEIYRAHGLADYLRRNTTIFARRPDAEEARLLDQHSDQPVMVLQKTDVAPDGRPIGCSESIWSAHRIQFSIASLDDADDA